MGQFAVYCIVYTTVSKSLQDDCITVCCKDIQLHSSMEGGDRGRAVTQGDGGKLSWLGSVAHVTETPR